jgi:hypothetical protein
MTQQQKTYYQLFKEVQAAAKGVRLQFCENCHDEPICEDSGVNKMCDACWETAQAIYQEESQRI